MVSRWAFNVYRNRVACNSTRLFTVEILFTIALTRSRMKGPDPPAGAAESMRWWNRVLRDAVSASVRKSPRGFIGVTRARRRYLNDEHRCTRSQIFVGYSPRALFVRVSGGQNRDSKNQDRWRYMCMREDPKMRDRLQGSLSVQWYTVSEGS